MAFGVEEDYLLSLVLHNLLVYMLMVGMSAEETTDFIHRLTARTRLATAEEKLLQKTLKLVEQNVRVYLLLLSVNQWRRYMYVCIHVYVTCTSYHSTIGVYMYVSF